MKRGWSKANSSRCSWSSWPVNDSSFQWLKRWLFEAASHIPTLSGNGRTSTLDPYYVPLPTEVKDTSLVEEVMLAALCVILAVVVCWGFYEGLVTGEVPKRGPGNATSAENPVAYWLGMGVYVLVILPGCLLGFKFAAGRLSRRLRRTE